jgi:hypothetical protein
MVMFDEVPPRDIFDFNEWFTVHKLTARSGLSAHEQIPRSLTSTSEFVRPVKRKRQRK